jgi:hypothetical protein
MASGRPRRPNDPSVLASLETAVSKVTRPGIFGLCWLWRYELFIGAGLPGAAVVIGWTLGITWMVAFIATGCALLGAAVAWPPSRALLVARAWCVITPHRVRTGCTHSWVQSRDGRLPVVLYTRPTEFGERVLLWCRAGITATDIESARDILRTACWAKAVQVTTSNRHSHIVVLDIIRRDAAGRPAATDALSPWPYLPHPEMDPADPEEPALSPQQDALTADR